MIELTVYEYLNKVLDVPVGLETPSGADEYVVIQKTGSGEENHIKTATFAVQSVSTSLYNAALLNEAVKIAMAEMPWQTDVSKCSLNSDYEWGDTTKKEYRYQAVFNLVY